MNNFGICQPNTASIFSVRAGSFLEFWGPRNLDNRKEENIVCSVLSARHAAHWGFNDWGWKSDISMSDNIYWHSTPTDWM